MLDYASNAAAYWPSNEVRASFEAQYIGRNGNPDDVLRSAFGEIDVETFWESVANNLLAAQMRILFVANEIPRELQRIIEFLNEHMHSIEVLGVDVRRFRTASEDRAYVARVVGQTAAAQRSKQVGRSGREWNEESFFDDLQARSPQTLAVARSIYKWMTVNLPRPVWGHGTLDGSYMPLLDLHSETYRLITIWSNASVELQFKSLWQQPPFDSPELQAEARQRFNAIPGVNIPMDKKRPNIHFAVLAEDGATAQFLAVLDWMVEKLKHPNAHR
jgi:hypothetical protein